MVYEDARWAYAEYALETLVAMKGAEDTVSVVTMHVNDRYEFQDVSDLDQMLLENDLPRKYSEQVLELESLHLVLLLLRNGIFSHETMSPKEGYSADIERALKYIALNYQQPLTLEEVAGYCNLSPTYFSRKFRLITGQTFKEHVNYIRLRQATQMLLMTDNSITKIAMLCGFGSSNYFKDLFRASTGRSPREYRKHSGLPIHPHLRDNG